MVRFPWPGHSISAAAPAPHPPYLWSQAKSEPSWSTCPASATQPPAPIRRSMRRPRRSRPSGTGPLFRSLLPANRRRDDTHSRGPFRDVSTVTQWGVMRKQMHRQSLQARCAIYLQTGQRLRHHLQEYRLSRSDPWIILYIAIANTRYRYCLRFMRRIDGRGKRPRILQDRSCP